MEGEKQGLGSFSILTSTFPFLLVLKAQPFRCGPMPFNQYELLVSPFIVGEFARVSRRDFHWDEQKVRLHVRITNKTGTVLVPQIIPDVIKEDPSDNHILVCALAGNANLIVSQDLDLLRLKIYGTIGIITPIDFLNTLGLKKAA